MDTLFSTEITLTNKLHIVANGEKVSWGKKEIFNSDLFDEFYGISYVSSGKLFSDLTRGFKKVKFVLGLPDGNYQLNFADSLAKAIDIEEMAKFWNELEYEVQKNIAQERIQIRYPLKKVIHSKIYLLQNGTTGKKRVIIGSTNLTEQAFSGLQYEEVFVVDDDSKLFQIYFERFEEIFNDSVDYINSSLKKKVLQEVDNETANIIIINTPDVLADLQVEKLIANQTRLVLQENEFEELHSLQQKKKQMFEYQLEKDVKTKEIISEVFKKSGKVYYLKSQQEIKKNLHTIKTILSPKYMQKYEDIDLRPRLIYNELDKDIIFTDDVENKISKFSREASREEIKASLEVINNFIEAYKRFTVIETKDHRSKVMEAIMYAFLSPYIWLARRRISIESGSEVVKTDIPIYLVIGGKAKSGKTTALEFIGLLLGYKAPYYFESPSGGVKSLSPFIQSFFTTENVTPVLMDEVPPNFFNASTGENKIKETSNAALEKHPTFILTTNAEKVSMAHQVQRRLYYLQIDNPFDTNNFNKEMKQYLADIKNNASDILFRDFLYRVRGKLNAGQPLFDGENILNLAREIFREYYEMCSLPIPEWFPLKPFDDYVEEGRHKWRLLFEHKREMFIVRKDGKIFVEEKLFSNDEEKKHYIDYLGDGCIERKTPLVLIKKNFYEFIGVKNDNVLNRVFGIFKIK
ncbi:hypothetical protein ciss_07760 [Carboxydothermus islandicus]|uniref:PLD phosphodiesterase domain-containing protein n=1 Tax=Carboxydothermus islandicus TaxID=661089 RepID=A0A1L8D123_9THEO|nr:phospholipase D family protein [Carboxydothermus islandicus]GAV24843.1 hypothetical protein ciss_07760 [Carboxydothermus islandicus]